MQMRELNVGPMHAQGSDFHYFGKSTELPHPYEKNKLRRE